MVKNQSQNSTGINSSLDKIFTAMKEITEDFAKLNAYNEAIKAYIKNDNTRDMTSGSEALNSIRQNLTELHAKIDHQGSAETKNGVRVIRKLNDIMDKFVNSHPQTPQGMIQKSTRGNPTHTKSESLNGSIKLVFQF